ncbi:MAG TPA: exodeoxyribonuclease V subunit gamma [Melioribacteraceae bacterium]|nr:exodeoxyribonuclease V subunit gamma [Melioribacteraceae bacterium]
MILSKVEISGIDLEKLIEDTIRTGNFNKLLVIVPTNRKSLYWRKQIVKESTNAVCSKIYMETLTTLSNKLLSLSVNFNIISEAAASVLIKQSFTEESLEYFNVYSNKIPTGTLDRIKNLISKFKENGITVDKILNEAKLELTGSNAKKACDIAKIFGNYKKKCRERKYFEIGDVYEEILLLGEDGLKENFKKIFPDIENIVFFGFDEFTSLEIEIVNMISNFCNTYVDFDYYEKNSSIFFHLDAPTKYFEVKGFNKINDLSITPYWEFKNLCRKHLFNGNINQPINNYKKNIIKIKAENKYKEIEYVAKEIKYILEKTGTVPNKICVAFNLIQNYSSIVRSVFAKYKIPLNLTDRYKLDNSSIIILLVNLLNIVENDYYYKDIFNVLDNKIIKKYIGEANSLIKAAGELKITIGKNVWKRMLEDKLAEYDDETVTNYYDELNKTVYIAALENFKRLEILLEPFEKTLSIDQFLSEINNLINNLNIHEFLLTENHNANKKNVAALSKFLEVISEIFVLLKSEYGNTELSLKFFIDNIKTACKWARYNTIGISECGVLVTTINEIRGIRFDYLFLGGMVDGVFPTKYQPEIFDRNKFNQKDRTHQTEERYHFYQTLNCFTKGLYFTLPINENESEQEESIFLSEFQKVFDLTEIIEPEKYYSNKIYNEDELLKLYGTFLRTEKLPEAGYLEELFNNLLPYSSIKERNNIFNRRSVNYLEKNEFNGYITENIFYDELKQKIESYLSKILERQFSVAQLDEYAKCHFKYFAKRVLKLETIKEPNEEMEVYEKGNLVHDILYDFYNELRENKLILNGCSNTTFIKIKEIMFKIATNKIENSILNLPISFFEKEKLIGDANTKENSILFRFLENERNRNSSYLPAYFEVKFGKLSTKEKDKFLSTDNPIEIGGIKLQGKIDRIDIDVNTNTYSVIDYKTGATEVRIEDIKNGYSNQLPVYLIATKKLLKDKLDYDLKAYNFHYYKLVYPSKKFGLNTFPDEKDLVVAIELNENTMKEAEKNISNLVIEITNGKFNLISRPEFYNKVCKICEFKSICRINEVKN